MVMVIIVIERIKRSRHEKVVVGQIKWAVDKSKRAISRKFEDGNQYEKVAVYALGGWRKKPRATDDFPFAANICGQHMRPTRLGLCLN